MFYSKMNYSKRKIQFFLAVVVITLFIVFNWDVYEIVSTSMENSLLSGDIVLVKRTNKIIKWISSGSYKPNYQGVSRNYKCRKMGNKNVCKFA